MIFKIIILAALLKILRISESPLFCSSIYAGIALIFGFLFSGSFLAALIGAVIAFALSSLYFWLLHKTDGVVWWLIMLGGLFIGLV